jgi:transcriptional regulator with XRE-family HTH domain
LAEQSPTVHRRLLGTQLRKLREKAGIKPDEVAEHLECHKAKVSRMEAGKVGITPRDARDMLDLYGITGTERDRLLEIAHQSRQRSMWHSYWNAVPEPFYNYLGLESSASSIKVFENSYINGLLQIEPYTRALIEGINPDATEPDREKIVALRQKRAEILTREDGSPDLLAVVDQAVISRVVGDAAVMASQLQHLIDMSDLPNVSIRIVPRSAGAYAGMEGSFFILEFPENEDLDVVFTEGIAGAFFLERPKLVHTHKKRFNIIAQHSLPPDASRELLKTTAKEFNLS